MSTVVILASGIGVALALPIAARVRAGRFDPFEPIFVFALAWGVMFVVRPIAIVIRDDTNFYGVDISPTLDKSVLLGLVGAVGFLAAYETSGSERLLSRIPRPPVDELTPRATYYAVIVGGIATLVLLLYLVWSGGTDAISLFLAGRSPEFNDLLSDSPLYLWTLSLAVVPAALVAFAVAYVHRTPSTAAGAVALLALALLRVVPTGSRLNLLMFVGGAVVFVYLQRQRRPGVVAIALGLVVALVGSYALLVFRDAGTRASVSSALWAVAEAPVRVLAPLTTRPDSEMAPALAGALLVIPEKLPHRYGGATLGDLVVRPIPRQVWSGKPQPHPIVVTEEVWRVARETGDFQPNFTPLLSFYWDFGLPGALLGMALFGWLARLGYRYLLREIGNMSVQLVYGVALSVLVVALRADPVLLAFHAVVMFVPLLLVLWLGARRTGDPVLQVA